MIKRSSKLLIQLLDTFLKPFMYLNILRAFRTRISTAQFRYLRQCLQRGGRGADDAAEIAVRRDFDPKVSDIGGEAGCCRDFRAAA